MILISHRYFAPHVVLLILAAGVAFCGFPVKASPPNRYELTKEERQGKQIYLRGESSSDQPVYALLGDPPMKVVAKMLPCVNCHGFDGNGIPEGGVTPSNITWKSLTKRYGVKHASGRRHGPYDESTLKRAITEGIDPSRSKLGVGMPRFSMSDADLSALVAYIKRIEWDRDPGVTDTRITVATILPTAQALKPYASAIRDVLKARFDEVNNSGGIYNRKITLRLIESTKDQAAAIDQLRDVLASESVFALVAPFVPVAAQELETLAAEREIPIIVPMSGAPDGLIGTNRFVFYLFSGLGTQTRALVDYYAEHAPAGKPSRSMVWARKGPPFEELARVAGEQYQTRGLANLAVEFYEGSPVTGQRLSKSLQGTDAVFFLGPQAEAATWLTQATKLGFTPRVFLLSAFLGEDVLAASRTFHGTLLAAFPNSRSAQSPKELKDYQQFLDRHAITGETSAAHLTAYCAATLFLDSLRRSGRQLRREQLIRKLEELYDYRTGLTHDVTYGPNRRVGMYGAYIVPIDLSLREMAHGSKWVEPALPGATPP